MRPAGTSPAGGCFTVNIARQDSDAYYHPVDAGQQSLSSFDDWDATGTTLQPRVASPPAGSITSALRRTSIPSRGSTDRRRLAIVEMEPSTGHPIRLSVSGGGPPSDLCSGGLALVAPPDVSPQNLPVSKLQPSISVSSDGFGAFPLKGVDRPPRKSLRDVALVGTATFPGSASVNTNTPSATDSLRPPVFQIPQSRSPSPAPSEISDSGCSTNRGRQRKDALTPGVSPVKEVKESPTPVRTPNIGESKHINERVAGPIVINLFPQSSSPSPAFSSPLSSTQHLMSPRTNVSSPRTPSTTLTSPATIPSRYLHYQPGLHAIAGPLPPPPQAIFNVDPGAIPPPRPPRHSPMRRKDDLEAMKQVLQLPPHVTAALRSKSSSPSTKRDAASTSPQKVTTTVPPSVSLPSIDSPPWYAALPYRRGPLSKLVRQLTRKLWF